MTSGHTLRSVPALLFRQIDCAIGMLPVTHTPLIASVSCASDCFASPNSIWVFGA